MKRKNNRLAQASSFVLEGLESRVLLSASIVARPVADTLRVNGTGRADTITVGLDAGNSNTINVTVNGVLQQFDKTNIHAITIASGSGNDVVTIDESNGALPVGVLISGGKGSDQLYGSSLNDSIYGSAGNDYIFGRAGDDLINAGKGSNTVWGDDGNDYILGGKSRDMVFAGAGDDTVLTGKGNDIINSGGGTNNIDAGAGVNHVDDAFSRTHDAPITHQHNVNTVGPAAVINAPQDLTVAQIRQAYNFGDLTDPLYTNRGAGQGIAIIVAYDDPTAFADLVKFSQQFGLKLPTAQTFQTIYANGTPPPLDPGVGFNAMGWEAEANLDVQWSHAIAPDANIYLVEAASNSDADLLQAVTVASTTLATTFGGGIVNMSLGGDEVNTDPWEAVFSQPLFHNVTYVAASGDEYAVLSHPSSSPQVLSVGGTTLNVDATGNPITPEVAWDDINGGGGSGPSGVFATPVFQQGTIVDGAPIGAFRITPDVSYNAGAPVSVYNTFKAFGSPNSGWTGLIGTSAGSPQWSGLLALVNQQRKARNATLLGQNAMYGLYQLGKASQTTFFNDITDIGSGGTGFTGFDHQTGWGTPKANTIIGGLASLDFLATGDRGFTWNAEYKEATAKYPGGVSTPLFADFRGTGRASIQQSSATMNFTVTQSYNGQIITITASNLARSGEGYFFGSGSALVVGPITNNFFTLSIAGFMSVDRHNEIQFRGSFTGTDATTGVAPVPGLDEQFSGKFSTL